MMKNFTRLPREAHPRCIMPRGGPGDQQTRQSGLATPSHRGNDDAVSRCNYSQAAQRAYGLRPKMHLLKFYPWIELG